MLSRVAESLFWMSRYFERAENTARFLDVNFNLLLDLNSITTLDHPNYWKPLIMVIVGPQPFRHALRGVQRAVDDRLPGLQPQEH